MFNLVKDIQLPLSQKCTFQVVIMFRLNHRYIIIIYVLLFYINVVDFRLRKTIRLSFPNILICCI